MSFGFDLQIALPPVLAIVVLQRAFDIHRMRVVPLNEIRVIAVHRAHEVRERGEKGRGQTAAEAGGLGRKIKGEIVKALAGFGGVTQDERFH